MQHYATVAQHEVPNRSRYVKITRTLETDEFSVSLHENKRRTYRGQDYGDLVLISTQIATEELARKIASAVWAHCKNHNDVQQIASVMVSLKAAAA